MGLARWLLGLGLMGAAGCTVIAGLDGDYTVGDVGEAGGGGSGASGGAAVSTSAQSGGAGGSGATGGAGGSGATGGGPPVEDCLDGVDNDGNMLVDCADPACQPDYECVPLPAVPSGWTGYFIVDSETYPAMTTQPCADTTQPDVLFSGPGDPAQCSGCACGNPMGGGCSFPTMGFWTNTGSCSGGANYSLNPGDGNCHAFPVNCGQTCSNDQRVRMTAQSAVTGNPTCTASGGSPTLPPLWDNEHHVCNLPATGGGGCQMGQACVSMGTSFGGACVQRTGMQTCPNEFPKPLTMYNNANDDRACSNCSCNASGVSCSGGNFVVSDDGSCMGGTSPDVTISGNTCTSVQNHLDENAASYRAVAGTIGGSCNPQGGQPTGSVTPSGEVTFCCL